MKFPYAVLALVSAPWLLSACPSTPDTNNKGSGGAATGGTSASGGNAGSGQAGSATGGQTSGGAASGGAPGSGGSSSGGTTSGGSAGSASGGASTGGSSNGGANNGGAGGALEECKTPSIDRLQQWLASGEGTTKPATGSLLVKDGDKYVAKVEFVNAEWHVIPVWLANKFEAQVDLSKSKGFTLTYSATDDFYVQLRPGSKWSGGDKYLVKIPGTGGKDQTQFFALEEQQWTTLPELGKPSYSFADAVKEVRGLVFVGKTPNTITFKGLRIDGYVPTCL